ncbi:Dynamin-like GTPase that mediates homotypic ER fusion [Kappamyces sp. JEL0680]|nr:Dynamin-like GTPase that mediates homotypic ER fusion [Kappamyces sp. JEL0680]
MNAKGGRGQTTKGIWMSREKSMNILVMDVEGTDGRERGEDQDFERKSALFSLAIAEVLIINMFEQSVGLYNGANMSLLRTVLEVNLQLFQRNSKSKTCLLFVLRDSTGQTPLESLSETLTLDLEKIWASLAKPPGKEQALLGDYFDLSFAAAAHKIFLPDKFASDLASLRERFLDKQHAGFLLKPKYHKGIPADGFSVFAKSIWEKICANRDLDLPTQQQLLAQYRCDEIAKSAFEAFAAAVDYMKPLLDKGKVLLEFGAEANSAVGRSLGTMCRLIPEHFDKDASRYHAETYKAKRLDFFKALLAHMHVFFLQQLRNLHKEALELFSKTFKVTSRGLTPGKCQR